MDVSLPSLGPAAAPRPVPDLRPTADAAATARVTRPPAAVAPAAPPVAPVSATQTGLVSRTLVADAAGGVEAAAGAHLAVVDPEARVLKPFGVGMLPSGEREVPRLTDSAEGEGAEEPSARKPEPADA